MYDFHMHSLFSDGELLPSEILRRFEVKGYKGIAITDHVDDTNLEHVLIPLVNFSKRVNSEKGISLLPGVELTHVRPSQIEPLAQRARSLGAKVIVVHGETIVEPVIKGTNRAAIEAEVDILAHPGLISIEDVLLAKEKGIYLEVTSRAGHSFTNGHVVKLARKIGCKLFINSDTHSPHNILDISMVKKVAKGAGLEEKEVKAIWADMALFIEGKLKNKVY